MASTSPAAGRGAPLSPRPAATLSTGREDDLSPAPRPVPSTTLRERPPSSATGRGGGLPGDDLDGRVLAVLAELSDDGCSVPALADALAIPVEAVRLAALRLLGSGSARWVAARSRLLAATEEERAAAAARPAHRGSWL